jgi:hypothetical protein
MWQATARRVESVLTSVTIRDLVGHPPDIPQPAAG